MDLNTVYATENACYQRSEWQYPEGVMVHSTGANNPNLRRYVQPDDGRLGANPYDNHFNTLYPGGRSVCVHAFIGKLANGEVATYQTLPWSMVGWHSGKGSKGQANRMGYIGFEICEDALTDESYFRRAWQEATELTAHLCSMYQLDPLKDGIVISHKEGNARGIASNHGDPEHWFSRFGKTMDDFRQDVANLLKEDDMFSYEDFKEYMERYEKELREQGVSDYAIPSCIKAVRSGLFSDGDGNGSIDQPQAYVKRQELAVILDRKGDLD